MVVLRSTTPCVAVSSRSNSNLLTVISIVPAATAASTGINASPQNQLPVLLLVLPYIKCKTIKTSSNSRPCGKVEISSNSPVAANFPPYPSCEKSRRPTSEPLLQPAPLSDFHLAIHNFHTLFTCIYKEDCIEKWKS